LTPTPPTTLAPVAVVFAVFGAFWGSFAVAVSDMRGDLGLSHGGFGLLLSCALAAAAVANALGGAVAERLGTARLLSSALVAWAALLVVAAGTRNTGLFAAVFVGVVGLAGLIDVAMNVAATSRLAATPGALVRFHALFNVGAAAGAASMGGLLGAGQSWRWAWVAIAATALVLSVVCARAPLPATGAGARVPLAGALPLLRRQGLVLVAAAFAVGAMVEGGIELWGVLFLRESLASGLLVGAGSATAAYLVAATARVVLGPVAGRGGAARGVAIGSAVACAGVVLLALAPSSVLSGVGLVLAAGGISLYWPLLLAHASAGAARPGQVVGAVAAVGYLGFVFGPTIVGWVSDAAGLRAGLLLLAAATVFVGGAPLVSGRRAARAGTA
jgi:MFS family permease